MSWTQWTYRTPDNEHRFADSPPNAYAMCESTYELKYRTANQTRSVVKWNDIKVGKFYGFKDISGDFNSCEIFHVESMLPDGSLRITGIHSGRHTLTPNTNSGELFYDYNNLFKELPSGLWFIQRTGHLVPWRQ